MSKATKKQVIEKEKQTKAKSKEKKEKKDKKNNNFIQDFILFSQDSWAEFKKIEWPTHKQAINESIVVLMTVVFIVALVNLYDFISAWLLNLIFQK